MRLGIAQLRTYNNYFCNNYGYHQAATVITAATTAVMTTATAAATGVATVMAAGTAAATPTMESGRMTAITVAGWPTGAPKWLRATARTAAGRSVPAPPPPAGITASPAAAVRVVGLRGSSPAAAGKSSGAPAPAGTVAALRQAPAARPSSPTAPAAGPALQIRLSPGTRPPPRPAAPTAAGPGFPAHRPTRAAILRPDVPPAAAWSVSAEPPAGTGVPRKHDRRPLLRQFPLFVGQPVDLCRPPGLWRRLRQSFELRQPFLLGRRIRQRACLLEPGVVQRTLLLEWTLRQPLVFGPGFLQRPRFLGRRLLG